MYVNAKAELVTLAPGLRPERRFAPLARGSCCTIDFRVRVLQIFDSVFYRFFESSPVRVLQIFVLSPVRVLQIFESSPVQSVFYRYSPVRVLQHAYIYPSTIKNICVGLLARLFEINEEPHEV